MSPQPPPFPLSANRPWDRVDIDRHNSQVARVRPVPNKTGTFEFHCDILCDTGHEDRAGALVVTE